MFLQCGLCSLQTDEFVLLFEGRAGRVSNGYCYRLVHKDFWTDCIPEKSLPEMLVRIFENTNEFLFYICGCSTDFT